MPLRTGHRLRGRTALGAVSEEVRVVQGVPTPARIVFHRPQAGERVTMTVDRVDDEAAIPEAFFSTFTLVKE